MLPSRKTWLLLSLLACMLLACGLATPSGGGGQSTSTVTLALPTLTPTSAPAEPTPIIFCTPPLCAPDEQYFCPADCPGGCGTVCATPTPGAAPGPLLLVYTLRGDLWVISGEEAPRRLVPMGLGGRIIAPQLSPDGTRVLFQREAGAGPAGLPRTELWVASIAGDDVRRLVTVDDLPWEMGTPMGEEGEVRLDSLPIMISWLPDSRRVAFMTRLEVGYGWNAHYDLWLVDTDSGTLTELLPKDAGGMFAFSPDGTALLVANPYTVSLLDADGRNRRELLTFDFVNTASEYAYAPQPAWSSDGRYGLVAITSAEPFGEAATCTLWRITGLEGAVQLGQLPTQCLFNTMEDRLWSPERSRLAYIQDFGGDLYLAAADGRGASVYASGVQDFLGWAPDGQHFAFSLTTGETLLGSLAAPAAPLVPAEAGQVFAIKWADAAAFALLSGEHAAPTLWVGELGGELRRIDSSVGAFDVRR